MARIHFNPSDLPNFSQYKNDVEKIIIQSLDEFADDVQLIAQKSAPVSGKPHLERTIERGPVNKSGKYVEVSAGAFNRGFNYARKMDRDKYNLGPFSEAKSRSGSIRSKFIDESFKVGSGYMSNIAEAVNKESARGYLKHIENKINKASRNI